MLQLNLIKDSWIAWLAGQQHIIINFFLQAAIKLIKKVNDPMQAIQRGQLINTNANRNYTISDSTIDLDIKKTTLLI